MTCTCSDLEKFYKIDEGFEAVADGVHDDNDDKDGGDEQLSPDSDGWTR